MSRHGTSMHGHTSAHGNGQSAAADAGVPGHEVQLEIHGMHCAACAGAVRRALQTVPGVRDASVSVTQGRAAVDTDGRVQPQSLVRAVQSAGYDAKPIEHLPAASELRSQIELNQSTHEREWRFRALVSLGVWIPLEALHWVAHWRGVHGAWVDWVMFAGATFVFMTAGGGFYRSAIKAFIRGGTNMDTLIALGATTAYVFSFVVFSARTFGDSASMLAQQPLYFAESAALLGIISLGHYLEARAAAQAGSAVRELLELQPEQAELLQGSDADQPQLVASADVQSGDILVIRPGGRVPVDGEVTEGRSDVDESIVTGESALVVKSPGDRVVAGSLNTTGRLIIKAQTDGRHTTISRIAELVQRAQSSKASIQRMADRLASIFVPVVLLIALATFTGWWFYGEPVRGVIATVTVLIISCPCALGLATPMAVMVGAGEASRAGIFIKAAMALEQAGKASVVIFDKTGTLTAGHPTVTAMLPSPQTSERELLRLAAAVESASEHPIARAIVSEARKRAVSLPMVAEFHALPGEGVQGVVEGKTVRVLRDQRASCRVEVNGQVIGRIQVADDLRADAREAVRQLRSMGLRVCMLSGDSPHVAAEIAQAVGIDEKDVSAGATPQFKREFVQRMRMSLKGRAVVMVGDGINDAAALAQADVGIAMASGTNIAIESANVVIPSDRVTAVPQMIDLARHTLRTIRQNLFFALVYNATAIPAAALGLLGMYGPLIAAAAMGASDITVVGNALRLKMKLRRLRSRIANKAQFSALQ